MKNIYISGFSDEISQSLEEQLRVVKELGMEHICFRSAEGKGIANFSKEELEKDIIPKLKSAGVKVSSLGSAIGKVSVEDEEGFQKQLEQLHSLCETAKALNCKYIRIFSFFIPEGKNPDDYKDVVLNKMEQFVKIAEEHKVILLHENEKDIYGDTGLRCVEIFNHINSPYLRAAFDFANFVQCNEDPESCWDMLIPFIEYIHIKDAVKDGKDNVLCGTGEGKIPELLKRAIKEENYEGFLTLEPHLVSFDFFAPSTTGEGQKVEFQGKTQETPAEAYGRQYNALKDILEAI